MADPHNSGKALLSKAGLLSITTVAVAGSQVAAEVMKLPSWARQFAWALIMIEAVIWLKRAMAFLINLQIIVVLQLRFLSHAINLTHLKTSPMEDSVRLLTPILSILALIEIEVEVT